MKKKKLTVEDLNFPFKMEGRHIKEVHEAVSDSYWRSSRRRANKILNKPSVRKFFEKLGLLK